MLQPRVHTVDDVDQYIADRHTGAVDGNPSPVPPRRNSLGPRPRAARHRPRSRAPPPGTAGLRPFQALGAR